MELKEDVLEKPACEQGDFETKWETCSCPNESGSQAGPRRRNSLGLSRGVQNFLNQTYP